MSGQADELPDYVRIHCGVTGKAHRAKGVLITTFVRHGRDEWTEHVTGPWRRSHLTAWDAEGPDSGLTLSGDSPVDHERLFSDDVDSYRRTLRNVYTIACPVCAPGHTPQGRRFETRRGENVQLTQEQLFSALENSRNAGISDLSLTLLSAIVQAGSKN